MCYIHDFSFWCYRRSSWVNPGGGKDSEPRRPDTRRVVQMTYNTFFVYVQNWIENMYMGSIRIFYINKVYQKKPKLINIDFFGEQKNSGKVHKKIKCF